jgi:predicted glutamine amidotransferase
MCGLIGYSGDHNTYDWQKIIALMLINTDRGKDACGFYYPIPNTNKYIIKKSDESFTKELVYDNSIKTKTSLFIGHDRQASSGFKNKENAHPFIFSNNHQVVCAHNGTLTFLYEILEMMRSDFPKYSENFFSNVIDVDSKIFSMYFSIAGIDKYKVLEYYEGAAALLFSDLDNPDKLYAYTDGSRPLHYGFINNNMYISSEKKPLEFIGCKKIKEFETNFVFEIEKGKILKKTKITKKKIIRPAHNHSNNHNNRNQHNNNVAGFLSFRNEPKKETSFSIKDLRILTKYANTLDVKDVPLLKNSTKINFKVSKDFNLLAQNINPANTFRIQPVADTFLIREWDKKEVMIRYVKNLNTLVLTNKFTIIKTWGKKEREEFIFKSFLIDMEELQKKFILSSDIEEDNDDDKLKMELFTSLKELESTLIEFERYINSYYNDTELENNIADFLKTIVNIIEELDTEDLLDITLLENKFLDFKTLVNEREIKFSEIQNIADEFTKIMIMNSKYITENG